MSSARRATLVLIAALLFAGLLNAQGLRKTAEIQHAGVRRDVALALTKPLVRISHALYLDRPRQELMSAIGRGRDDRVDTTVVLPSPPPPPQSRPQRPHPRKVPRPRTPVAPKPTFTAAHPLRIWVAGDSLAQIPGEALERLASGNPALDVVGLESHLDTGLSRPDLYNWFERFPAAVASLHPRAAILFFGADDAHDYMTGVPAGRTLGSLGSTTWDAEYKRRVDGVTRELNDAGVTVIWVGLPITRGLGFRRSFPVVNHILRDVVAAHQANTAYVDTWTMFMNGKRRYADYLRNAAGQLALMRAPDGVHYEPAAGDLIASAVVERLTGFFNLAH